MQIDMSRIGRGTGPVSNNKIFSALKSITMTEVIRDGDGNANLRQDYTSGYKRWIEACSVAPVTGLEQFSQTYFANGVTQGYDIFFSEHRGRRFRTLKGDYPYVRLSVDDWCQDCWRRGIEFVYSRATFDKYRDEHGSIKLR